MPRKFLRHLPLFIGLHSGKLFLLARIRSMRMKTSPQGPPERFLAWSSWVSIASALQHPPLRQRHPANARDWLRPMSLGGGSKWSTSTWSRGDVESDTTSIRDHEEGARAWFCRFRRRRRCFVQECESWRKQRSTRMRGLPMHDLHRTINATCPIVRSSFARGRLSWPRPRDPIGSISSLFLRPL